MKRTLSSLMTWRDLGCIVGGSLLFSLAMNLLIVPMELFSGGFLGIAQLLRSCLAWLGLSSDAVDISGLAYLVLNIPLFLISLRSLGKAFLCKTLVAVVCYTVFLSLIVPPEVPYLSDRLTSCLLGGVVAGVGAGTVLRSGGCGGGEEILGIYLAQKYKFLSIGRTTFLINLLVYGTCLFLFNAEIVVYSLLYSVFACQFIDKMHFQKIMTDVIIISKKDGVRDLIFRSTGRGVTHWEGRGGYTDEPANILLTVVSKHESAYLRRAVKEYDPEAFVVINEDVDVEGNFELRM